MRTLACTTVLFGLSLGLLAASGCSFHARDENGYRKATRELLETRNADIKTCYDTALKKDPKVGGVVVVKFTVAKETGALEKVKINEKKTTAPAELGECVVKALDGLALDPPDAREGKATFQWEFQVKG